MAPINGWPLMGICNKLLPLPSDAIIQVRLVQPFGSYPVLPMAWDDMASRFLCEVWLRAASLVNSPCCGTHPAHAACTKRRSLGDKELQIPASSPLPLWGKGLWYAKKIAGDYRDLSLGMYIHKVFSFIWAIHWTGLPGTWMRTLLPPLVSWAVRWGKP